MFLYIMIKSSKKNSRHHWGGEKEKLFFFFKTFVDSTFSGWQGRWVVII